MSQQKKLERVLDLLLSEDSNQAAELLHQVIVEKARVIYESIVDEEDSAEDDMDAQGDVVGGEPNKDFTDAISSDQEEIDADEHNDGEASDDFDDLEDKDEEYEDFKSQIEELRAKFSEITGELLDTVDSMEDELDDNESEEDEEDGYDDEADDELDSDFDEIESDYVAEDSHCHKCDCDPCECPEEEHPMFEKKKSAKLKVAPQAKKMPKGKKMAEETQFLKKTADTGQRGTAKFVGTGKDSHLGAEQDRSVFSKAPSKPSYGGTPDNLLGSKSTGGEYGKFTADKGKDDTLSDNLDVKPKHSSIKADSTAKYTGGKVAGEGFNKSPLTRAPSKPGSRND
jgi:hypothetical protein